PCKDGPWPVGSQILRRNRGPGLKRHGCRGLDGIDHSLPGRQPIDKILADRVKGSNADSQNNDIKIPAEFEHRVARGFEISPGRLEVDTPAISSLVQQVVFWM